MPRDPLRAFRCNDELWSSAQEKADAEGRPLSEVIRELLSRWVTRPPRKR
ncbi:ribbon-helix-helix protein, CopG family [Mycobacteroides abscessus]|nr:ribbon-helix-helix protein, CopG family [Mycobacteroides abscessus subsp. massiliense]MBN7530512.1 ribbon-helix-helix protein, CopG family [Mycobacteroides abscessus subsp. abscessus]QSM88305.1 ribbon-helix-helix protein, CopG family [Mycobacteroides abscessus subsp. bolletii]RIS71108.1 ribbon-helix-helix protein, CopG family [Mycobacteroides abscessus]MBN7563405.1 ribbon-helix-helix protein, CopG family [Mycobacteroides abscessus subsp. massiliense]